MRALQKKVFRHGLFALYALQNIMESLQCIGARSLEDLSWDTVVYDYWPLY